MLGKLHENCMAPRVDWFCPWMKEMIRESWELQDVN